MAKPNAKEKKEGGRGAQVKLVHLPTCQREKGGAWPTPTMIKRRVGGGGEGGGLRIFLSSKSRKGGCWEFCSTSSREKRRGRARSSGACQVFWTTKGRPAHMGRIALGLSWRKRKKERKKGGCGLYSAGKGRGGWCCDAGGSRKSFLRG